ncbi:MAG TPA: hypothetical protein VK509_13560 [Polyangiales bacterium]|nr:hypothetical protein [Polyangiales bacterium]
MRDPVNVLALVHGIIPMREPSDHRADYGPFWDALCSARRELRDFAPPIEVEWGHPLPGARELRADQRLGVAQKEIASRVEYRAVSRHSEPLEEVIPHSRLHPPTALLTRLLTDPIKEQVALLGLSDVVYYCSEEGERALRLAVYGTVLQALDPYRDARELRLHVFGHSLGVTVAFDFLFGLFAPSEMWAARQPDFATDPGVPDALRERYLLWRSRATEGRLLLGSKSSAASQLPLLLLRKQKLVDMFTVPGARIDASVIGIREDGAPHWLLFYDVDDVLGFPTRPLFAPERALHEIEVRTGLEPLSAHLGYWRNVRVQEEVANLLASRSA